MVSHLTYPENMAQYQDLLILTDKEVKVQPTIDLFMIGIHLILINFFKMNCTEE